MRSRSTLTDKRTVDTRSAARRAEPNESLRTVLWIEEERTVPPRGLLVPVTGSKPVKTGGRSETLDVPKPGRTRRFAILVVASAPAKSRTGRIRARGRFYCY